MDRIWTRHYDDGVSPDLELEERNLLDFLDASADTWPDRPALTLTLGLTGERGIQKSIAMGFRAETDGIFAMVQGQDVVFVLDRKLVEMLTRDLVRAAPAAAAD